MATGRQGKRSSCYDQIPQPYKLFAIVWGKREKRIVVMHHRGTGRHFGNTWWYHWGGRPEGPARARRSPRALGSAGQHDMNHYSNLKPELGGHLVYQQGMTYNPQQQPQVDSGVQTSRTGIERREEARAPDPPPRAIYAQLPASGEENPRV